MLKRGQHGSIPVPDMQVSATEDRFIQSGYVPQQPDVHMCLRPGYGVEGSAVTLWTNYIEVKSQLSDVTLHRYTMTVTPARDTASQSVRRKGSLSN